MSRRNASVQIPPMAALVARFADPEFDPLPPAFVDAWRQMPALVAQLLRGEGHSNEGTTRQSIMDAAAARDIAQSRDADTDRLDFLARAVDMLEAEHEDYLISIVNAYAEPAFFIGLALAAYLLTMNAPVPMPWKEA
jgi:hypothetical protein